jgi:hypothetical protein
MGVENVRVGSTGTCELAPLGTALPANANSALDAAFVDLGEISADGLEAAFDVSTEQVRNWRGAVLRTLHTETTPTFKLMFMETSEAVVNLYYGSEVESQVGNVSRILLTTPSSEPQVMVITTVDLADNRFKRYVISRAVVSEREAISEVNSDAAMHGCTVSALWDDTLDGFGYVQFDDDLTS